MPTNSGALLATIAGIEASTGDFVFLLDGDDVWAPDKIARALAAFRADPKIAFVTHDLVFTDENGRPHARASRPAAVLGAAGLDRRSKLIRDGLLHHRDYVWLGSAMGLRRSLADVEGFCAWAKALPDPANTYQDWPLAYWVACQPGVAFAYVPATLLRYRLHGRNHSADTTTPDKALRNFTRTRNTLQALEALGRRFALDPAFGRTIALKHRFAAYLVGLYGGERGALRQHLGGLAGLLRVPDIDRRKELARWALLSILGPDRFIAFTRSYKP